MFAHLSDTYGRESLKKKPVDIPKPKQVTNNLSSMNKVVQSQDYHSQPLVDDYYAHQQAAPANQQPMDYLAEEQYRQKMQQEQDELTRQLQEYEAMRKMQLQAQAHQAAASYGF